MDQTYMQQNVKESVEHGISKPQETDTSSTQPKFTITDKRPFKPLTYDELFRELPNARNKTIRNKAKANIDKRITSSITTQMFRVPFEERVKIDGINQFGKNVSSRICTDIAAKTGAHIEISTARDQSLTFLITGKNEEVLKAKKLTLEKFQTQARQTIKIPKEHHRFIIGKKGKKLQELEAMTGTKIHVPSANDPSMDIIILGTKDSVTKAYREIQLVSDAQSKQAFEILEIPKIYHPFINTGTNQKLNQLMSEKNVLINLPPPSIPKNEITIAGEKEGVLQCKELINKIYKKMEKECQTVSVEVKKSQHKYVAGYRGANIKDILHATNVSVEMPLYDSPSETITLRGPQDKLGTALILIYEKASSVVTENVKAPSWLHKFIIGPKGSSIKNITQDLPKVHVEFTGREEGIKLEGPPEEVQIAHEKLENMIADLQAKLNYEELAIDPQYYKHIIGKNDSNINRIRNEFDVLINISEVKGKHLIRLEGNRDGIAQTKNELEELVKKIENEKERIINIENRFHRNIIGTKGDKIKEIREKFNQVQISFPDQGEKSDAVKIRGPEEDVDQCFKYLQRMKKELTESNFQVKFSIFHQFHKYIIGKAGSNINKIREETNTKIELPSEGQNSDDIIITGKKENCEKARERIQNELANIIEVDILIPSKFHNAMMGAGGKLIQSISEECGGVSIMFPPPDSKLDKVTIRGPKEDVSKAKCMLIELSNEEQFSGFVAEVKAKPELHRFLIGRNGVNVRKIRDSTGARIIFPNGKDQNKELITIIGKKESVEKAQAELQSIMSDLDKVIEEVITVDPKYHTHFVARRGDVLKQISDQYGEATISFPRQGVTSDKVTIKGIKECVEGAKNRVLDIVEDLKLMVTLEVNIPQKHHQNVMGPRGIKVQSITSDYDVQIKFPEKDFQSDDHYQNGGTNHRPQDIVIIQGKKDKCEAAKEALLALVPMTEEMDVPFKYHDFIIGKKSTLVRSLMAEYDVNVQVPPADEQRDSIITTELRFNVDDAESTNLDKVGNFLKEEEEEKKLRSFQVPPADEQRDRIITTGPLSNVDDAESTNFGKVGNFLKQVEEKKLKSFQLPPEDEQGDNIITTGPRSNVDDAESTNFSKVGNFLKEDEEKKLKSFQVPPADEQRDSIITTELRFNVDDAESTNLGKVGNFLKEEEEKN